MLAAHIDCPRLSAQVLLAHVLGVGRLDMLLEHSAPVSLEVRSEFETLAVRRCAGEPVAYLIGHKEFYGHSFVVNSDVLIPRPETEGMIDMLRDFVSIESMFICADIGTGSGALAVTAALDFPLMQFVATDISWSALRVACKNAETHNVVRQISFVQTSLLDSIDVGALDIVLANLPYVPAADAMNLSREVSAYEPVGALFGGFDGLDWYRRLAMSMRGKMKTGAVLLCEIDHRQGDAMRGLWSPLCVACDVRKDFAGYDRMVVVVF